METFLGEETPIFPDIRGVLDQQFKRLSPLEQDILLWLAISREPLIPTRFDHYPYSPGRAQKAAFKVLGAVE